MRGNDWLESNTGRSSTGNRKLPGRAAVALRWTVASALAIAFLVSARDSSPSGAAAIGSSSEDFAGEYVPPVTPIYTSAYRELAKDAFLEQITQELTKTFDLPSAVTIAFEECGAPRAFYNPAVQRISLCYELIASLGARFANERDSASLLSGALIFILFHELGHALVHVCELPVTGLEEDAVDQLSTLFLIENGGEDGVTAAASGAAWFAMKSRSALPNAGAFSDEHSLDAQRFYNIMCWIYGRDPAGNRWVVDRAYLPGARARRCPAEYQKVSRAWERLLEPFVRKETQGIGGGGAAATEVPGGAPQDEAVERRSEIAGWWFAGSDSQYIEFELRPDGTLNLWVNRYPTQSSEVSGFATGRWSVERDRFGGSIVSSTIPTFPEGHSWDDAIKSASDVELVLVNEAGQKEIYTRR